MCGLYSKKYSLKYENNSVQFFIYIYFTISNVNIPYNDKSVEKSGAFASFFSNYLKKWKKIFFSLDIQMKFDSLVSDFFHAG